MSFIQIPNSKALIRVGKGTFKDVPLFYRGEEVYVPVSGGYARIGGAVDSAFRTSRPDIHVIEIEATGVTLNKLRQPRWTGKNRRLKAVA